METVATVKTGAKCNAKNSMLGILDSRIQDPKVHIHKKPFTYHKSLDDVDVRTVRQLSDLSFSPTHGHVLGKYNDRCTKCPYFRLKRQMSVLEVEDTRTSRTYCLKRVVVPTPITPTTQNTSLNPAAFDAALAGLVELGAELHFDTYTTIVAGTKPVVPVPASRLVGIELNPGPPKIAVIKIKKAKKTKNKSKNKGKVVVLEKKIEGHGDYRPSNQRAFRTPGLSGRGDYFTPILKGATAVANTIGSIGSLLGFGDYRSRAESLNAKYSASGMDDIVNPQSMSMGTMNAQFGGKPPRVQHREFIGLVQGSVAFMTTAYRIQPGLVGTNALFPWGSSVAKSFEQYILHSCILEYVSTSTDFSAATGIGSVIMSTVYDAQAPLLTSQAEVDNHEFTTTRKPSLSFIHPIECATDSQPVSVRYVQTSNTVSTSTDPNDRRFDDVGIFQISTVGMPVDNAAIGELWCVYDISFLKPELPIVAEGTSFAAVTTVGDVSPSGSLIFGSPNYHHSNSIAINLNSASDGTNTITFPTGYPGYFLLNILGTGLGWVSSAPVIVPVTLNTVGFGSNVSTVGMFSNLETQSPDTYAQGDRYTGRGVVSAFGSQDGIGASLCMIVKVDPGADTGNWLTISTGNLYTPQPGASLNVFVTYWDGDISPYPGYPTTGSTPVSLANKYACVRNRSQFTSGSSVAVSSSSPALPTIAEEVAQPVPQREKLVDKFFELLSKTVAEIGDPTLGVNKNPAKNSNSSLKQFEESDDDSDSYLEAAAATLSTNAQIGGKVRGKSTVVNQQTKIAN